jgi:hypothetical protein
MEKEKSDLHEYSNIHQGHLCFDKSFTYIPKGLLYNKELAQKELKKKRTS